MRRHSDEIRAAIVADYRRGEKIAVIAARHNVGRRTVFEMVEGVGRELDSAAPLPLVLILHYGHTHMKDLKRLLKCSSGTVYNYVRGNTSARCKRMKIGGRRKPTISISRREAPGS